MSTDRDYLAAGLALGGLSEDELAEARALSETDADFRSEVAAYADSMALLAESDDPQPIDRAVSEAILAIPSSHAQDGADSGAKPAVDEAGGASAHPHPSVLAAGPDTVSARNATPPTDIRTRRLWPILAAAAAILVIAGLGANAWVLNQRQSELEEQLATTEQRLDETTRLMQAGDLRTNTVALPEGGSITVVSSEAEQLIHVSSRDVDVRKGTSLQMWVIGDEGPRSAGLMVGDAADITDRRFSGGSLFGITIEPQGGSAQPTSEPIAAVEL